MIWPEDSELEAAGWVTQQYASGGFLSAPRVRQYYWVDFPHDANAPEFVGEHPGVVVRAARALHGTCIIVPVTSRPQRDEKYVHKLSQNPNPVGHTNGIDAYVICDHLYTVNICRLRPILDGKGKPLYPRVDEVDFAAVCGLVRLVLFPPGPKLGEGVQPTEIAAETARKTGPSGRPILGLRKPTEEP